MIHVPSLKKNLLSVHMLCDDNDVVVEFTKSNVFVKVQVSRTTLLQGTERTGLYEIPARSENALVASVGERTSADCWHKRLGHPNQQISKKLISDFHLPLSSKILNVCEDCVVSKTHKFPFMARKLVLH